LMRRRSQKKVKKVKSQKKNKRLKLKAMLKEMRRKLKKTVRKRCKLNSENALKIISLLLRSKKHATMLERLAKTI